MKDIITIKKDSRLKPSYLVLQDRETLCFIKNRLYHTAEGLAVIITEPDRTKINRNQVILLVHGHLSHKNAIYQPLLAKVLGQLGYWVIRFDFRNQGDSETNANVQLGRTISQDIEDLETIIKSLDPYFCKDFEEMFGENKMTIEMVIAHSRGVLPVMKYFGSIDMSGSVPYLVNCCGRYASEGLLKRYTKLYPKWRQQKGFWTKTFYNGKQIDYWVPEGEILSTGEFSTECFKNIPKTTKVVNIYGTCDHVIPVDDATQYHTTFGNRSFQFWISGSDHNFYGLIGDRNRYSLPTRRGKVNYSYYLVALIYLGVQMHSFGEINESQIESTLTKLVSSQPENLQSSTRL